MLRAFLNLYRFIFARPVFQPFNTLVFQASLRSLGVMNYESTQVSGERYFIQTVLPQTVVEKSPVFVDVGAHVGTYSQALLRQFPNARLYGFEPHPKNFSALQKNLTSPRVSLYNLAMGARRAELTLYDRRDLDGSPHASLHRGVIEEIHQQPSQTHTVAVETLDAFCAREQIGAIDLLKIDTEGNELAVLRGAQQLLAARRIRCIHFEFNEMNIVSGVFFRDFRNLLQEFQLFRLLPQGMLPLGNKPVLTELYAYQNIIAVPKGAGVKI